MPARVCPGQVQQPHHFVSASAWPHERLERVLAEQADCLVGGPDAVLVVDNTALVKQGRHSVGVQRQYCGQLGMRANCQALVSLTLARAEVPVPVSLRVEQLRRSTLPAVWAKDGERRRVARVPDAVQGPPSGALPWTRSAACAPNACGSAACWAMPSTARWPLSATPWTTRACCGPWASRPAKRCSRPASLPCRSSASGAGVHASTRCPRSRVLRCRPPRAYLTRRF